jgi:hypothetical protein
MSTNVMPRTALTDFLHYLATGDDPNGLIDENMQGDMNFPHHSFTFDGKAAFDTLRDGVSDGAWVLNVEAADPTPDGFVAVIEIETSREGHSSRARTITTVTLKDDRVAAIRHWCTGAL